MQFTPQLAFVSDLCLVTDNSLDPVFTNFSLESTFFVDVGGAKPVPYHQPIVTENPLVLHNCVIS
jgi:hypothetical protein